MIEKIFRYTILLRL